jgi:hypothetical protein
LSYGAPSRRTEVFSLRVCVTPNAQLAAAVRSFSSSVTRLPTASFAASRLGSVKRSLASSPNPMRGVGSVAVRPLP